METVYRDYADRGVQFFYIYKSLAHPEINNFVPPFSIDERLKHIARAKSMLHSEIPWICDTMENDVSERFGRTYNGEFILDPEGKLVRKRFWSNPDQLRKDLVELIGPVDPITEVADVPAVFQPRPRKLASNVVPRPIRPSGLQALQMKPKKSEDPFFAKLRVEAPRRFFRGAQSELFLTVYLDPIHEVHWNNQAGKIRVSIEHEPNDYEFSKETIESLDVKVDADVDPRWFVLKGQAIGRRPFTVNVDYVICDDAETFCKPVRQSYEVTPIPDPWQGTRPGIFLNDMFADVRQLDRNGDQRITADEIPAGVKTMYIGHLDYNGNQIIEFEEIDTFMRMFNNGEGVDSTNDGG